jgi:basic membrane protein A
LTADPSVQDVIMTSMLKNVDVAVNEYLTEVDGGTFPSGPVTYDLESDGVGYSTSGGQVDDITDKLEDYKKQIIDGQIKVPTSP